MMIVTDGDIDTGDVFSYFYVHLLWKLLKLSLLVVCCLLCQIDTVQYIYIGEWEIEEESFKNNNNKKTDRKEIATVGMFWRDPDT